MLRLDTTVVSCTDDAPSCTVPVVDEVEVEVEVCWGSLSWHMFSECQIGKDCVPLCNVWQESQSAQPVLHPS